MSLWIMACGGLLAFRLDFIYPFRDWPVARQVSGLPGASVREVIAPDGVPITVWHVPRRAGKPYILHFMGNAGSLPSSGPKLTELAMQGYGIVAMNYRGAGGAPGSPSEGAIVADALAVHDAFAAEPLIVYGTSLGAAVAMQLAAQRPVQALILETPFTSACKTSEHHFPLVPACWLMWDERWDSLGTISAYQGPLLILHGDADRIVPISDGRKLFEAANEPKTFVTYPGGRHNDLRLHGSGQEILRFLSDLPQP